MALNETTVPVAAAFDCLAADYDSIFTFSAVGKSQRDVVWKHLSSVFHPGQHILELNCGTGVDALFMVSTGLQVTACDASPRMIELARQRISDNDSKAPAEFFILTTEDLHRLPASSRFDGLFSNFAGLNCVADLKNFATEAARRLKPGAPLLLCFLTPFCLWETVYYLLWRNPRKALRRFGGSSLARVGDFSFPVYYRKLSELRRIFAPEFRLIEIKGIGITVPPSYLEKWIASHTFLLRGMAAVDDIVREWPGVRVIGDHMLLHLERVGRC